MTEHRYNPHRSLMRVLARAMGSHGSVPLALRSEFVTAAWKSTPRPERARMLADLAEDCHPDAELTALYPRRLRREARAHARKTPVSRYEVDPQNLPDLTAQLGAALELVAARSPAVEL
ncbi:MULTISPECIES: hypothetical protein [unclassified Streptomyces]|uniref:hypothetical protein n=1 Tax=unclassified Streptomyces TaxID=2593676 RepID=UPI002DD88F65|nr:MULTISPECIES: hypothetical protein [unclassified Streptomyces]WSA97733.1 hypothetical protein OIE63_40310 [Streptomyces sp. NBC_01795]WSB82017.1 hypothetical protein OHB04_40510 [Streptomyces sp. NBC_01775]WSS46750.1 hypothetical protein OG220_39910 [Streptomyces sp. NBC_01187]WSS47033.1 hypothetical protein OG220_41715 [Streptomyces sp. NBC_01187]